MARIVEVTRVALLPIAVTVLGLAALTIAQSVPNRHSIEDKLTDRSTHALARAGLSDVEVDFVGRDATVRARSTEDGERAVAIVRAQQGVRVARVHLVAVPDKPPASPPPVVHLAIDGGRVVISGTVPSASARAALVNALAPVFGAGAVDDGLTVDPRVTDTGLAGLGDVAAALGKDARAAAVDLRGGTITLTGVVATPATREAATAAAGRAVGSPSAVVDRLVVASPPASQDVQARLVALPAITFESGSATLTAQGQASVAQAAAILSANPGVNIRIEGHTDSSGTAPANLALSQARAQTVLTALTALGIAPGRLVAAGFGETRPKVPDTTPENQAINRRVDLVVVA